MIRAAFVFLVLSACSAPPPEEPVAKVSVKPKVAKLDKIARVDFNKRAAELALPLFWIADKNSDKALEPDELAILWGVADSKRDEWVKDGGFTDKMQKAYADMQKPAAPKDAREKAVLDELAQGRPTLVATDVKAADKAFVDDVLDAAKIVETIYAKQKGVAQFFGKATDPASKMVLYRNQSPFCEAPKTEKDPDCNAIEAGMKKVSGLYPAEVQKDYPGFCTVLEKRKDADKLMHEFFVVRGDGALAGDPAKDPLKAVPYNVEYKAEMDAIADKLAHAAGVVDASEGPLKAYLEAASASFKSGDWLGADEAWAKMTATNSQWYLRIAPDETYFEPCSSKAGFQVSFARINPDSLAWQKKLEPEKTEMEHALAALTGAPYKQREVTFHLPDFIDIVLNAGDARNPTGATIGESLPNWGPVANEGRGRTVAMVNLYTDPDSIEAQKDVVSSLLCKDTFAKMPFDPKVDVMSVVLHEASHNLGPAHEYKVNGKKDEQVFGGSLASMLEELKAQTSALYFADWLVGKGTVTQAEADAAHHAVVAWAFGHIAQGMVDADGKPKPYSQLASIQMGTLFNAGVLAWKADEAAANGTDKGCFAVDLAKWKPAVEALEKQVLHIKGAGDKNAALALQKQFTVDDDKPWTSMRKTIAERWLRLPKASFVYAVNE
jgi:hypothetical protein